MSDFDIEIVITSYNRWHLLQHCVNTLFNLIGNKYKTTIIEDSVNQTIKNNIILSFGDKVNLIFNDQNIGQIKSIDKAYSQVSSKYILKVEDDYIFHGNANFIAEGIDILENNNHIHNIWLRHIDNYRVSHGPIYMSMLFENQVLNTPNKTHFRMLNKLHCGDWSGFTFMPHIHRLSDYKMMFPNGYFDVSKESIGVFGEKKCNDHAREHFNLRAAQLLNGCCETRHNETTYR